MAWWFGVAGFELSIYKGVKPQTSNAKPPTKACRRFVYFVGGTLPKTSIEPAQRFWEDHLPFWGSLCRLHVCFGEGVFWVTFDQKPNGILRPFAVFGAPQKNKTHLNDKELFLIGNPSEVAIEGLMLVYLLEVKGNFVWPNINHATDQLAARQWL